MTEETHNNYSFELSAKTRKRFVAGKYDVNNHKPVFTIEIQCPKHVRNLIKEKQILLGTSENCNWVYDIYNGSTWSVFVIVKKDGLILKSSN